MGHSTIAMTYDTYGHLFEDAKSGGEAFAQIEARLVS